MHVTAKLDSMRISQHLEHLLIIDAAEWQIVSAWMEAMEPFSVGRRPYRQELASVVRPPKKTSSQKHTMCPLTDPSGKSRCFLLSSKVDLQYFSSHTQMRAERLNAPWTERCLQMSMDPGCFTATQMQCMSTTQ